MQLKILQGDITKLKVDAIVNESNLDRSDRAICDASYRNLGKVMINPKRPNKNRGKRFDVHFFSRLQLAVPPARFFAWGISETLEFFRKAEHNVH